MVTHASGAHAGTVARSPSRSMMVSGWTMLASVLMIFGGLLAVATGVAALGEDAVFASTQDYAFEYSLTGWGWIHLTLGAVIVVAGLALTTGAMWARVVGITLAGLGMLANFMWLPHSPVWAVILLAIDVFIIWALCAGMGSRSRTGT
ncbi:MAG: DUF7144 family membrane protein [Streptomyces sp.]|uniref:DUF7144 family membrane protein n=1 Tax=Streptomyces sp. TaxID=1931 RepID=UPI003D6A2DD8